MCIRDSWLDPGEGCENMLRAATENTRREAQRTARRTRAKHQEAPRSQRGESIASIKIASVVGRVQPLLAPHKERREEPEQSTRRHHEANVARASRASRLRVWWVACSPCSRAARARRAFGAGAFREFLERFGSELSGSIPGKAAKTCCARWPGVWSWSVS